jgi:hypothetical protein
MSADTKPADLLRRLADKVIRDLKPNDDPLCNMCREFERRLADGCHDDDFEAFSENGVDHPGSVVDSPKFQRRPVS